jgi:fumarylacetoacetase
MGQIDFTHDAALCSWVPGADGHPDFPIQNLPLGIFTPAQMIAHHTVGGCNLQPGDLLGSGTISAPEPEGCGSILEATLGGKNPVRLESGEERSFLEDGDEVILCARGRRPGFAPLGFGECRATILPAR